MIRMRKKARQIVEAISAFDAELVAIKVENSKLRRELERIRSINTKLLAKNLELQNYIAEIRAVKH